MSAREFDYEFTVECPHGSVDYLLRYCATKGQPQRGPTYDCAGTPAEDPEVYDARAYYVARRNGKKVLERRPELDDAVSEDALLQHAGEIEEGEREDYEEMLAEARREDF